MPYFLLGLAALALLLLAIRGVARSNPTDLAKAVRKFGGGALLFFALLLAVTGRFPIAAPLAILGLSLLMRGGGLGFPFPFPPGRADKSAGRASSVRTDTLEMALDHDTGVMEGRVLKGRFAGRRLSDLSLDEMLALRGECLVDDPKAAQILEAYLDRIVPDWREHMVAGVDGGPMTREEAWRVLGLAPGASAEEIHRVHRQLMKKLHPDRGGSTYLAAKINEAKDILLADV